MLWGVASCAQRPGRSSEEKCAFPRATNRFSEGLSAPEVRFSTADGRFQLLIRDLSHECLKMQAILK